jgi:protein-disulfide isomerase
MKTLSPLRLLLSLSLLLLCAAGCDQLQPKQAEPKADPEACAKYTEKLCEAAGKDSPKCQDLTKTLKLLPPAACSAGMADVAFTKQKLAEAGKSCQELIDKLCKEIGEETQTCSMVKEQTVKFPPDRCDMMLSRFDEVAADLKRMEAKNKPLPDDVYAKMLEGDLPSFGPADAKVTIVEFSDFQCPFCSRAAKAVHEVKDKYGDKVRFVFRQFPLSFHKDADRAAQASLAAHAQGKFWELHDAMFEDPKKLDAESLKATAKAAGLDMAAFDKALQDGTYAEKVKADMKLGQQAGVDGTPTIYINGKRSANPTDFATLSKEIEAALAGG